MGVCDTLLCDFVSILIQFLELGHFLAGCVNDCCKSVFGELPKHFNS
jgi:hypothetical protein